MLLRNLSRQEASQLRKQEGGQLTKGRGTGRLVPAFHIPPECPWPRLCPSLSPPSNELLHFAIFYFSVSHFSSQSAFILSMGLATSLYARRHESRAHFTAQKTEAQRDAGTWLWSHCGCELEVRLDPTFRPGHCANENSYRWG